MLFPEASAVALATSTVIVALADPSNDADPVASPASVIVRAVVSLPALATTLLASAVLSTFPNPTSDFVRSRESPDNA